MNEITRAPTLKEKMAQKKIDKRVKVAQRKFDALKPEDKEFNWKEVHYISGLVRDLLISNASIITIAQGLTPEVKALLPNDFAVRHDTVMFDTNRFSATWCEIVKQLQPATKIVDLDDINTIYVIYEQLNELRLDILTATEAEALRINADIQLALDTYNKSLTQETSGE